MALAGKGGSVKIGVQAVTQVSTWKIDLDKDLLEISNMGSAGWKEFIAGLKGATGSIECEWNLVADTTGQKALQDSWFNDTQITLDLGLDATKKFSASAWVKKIGVEVPVGDKVKQTYELQFTGAVTYS